MNSDYAAFYHLDSAASFAIIQDSYGETWINSAAGMAVKFAINESLKVYVNASTFSPESDNAMTCGSSGKRWSQIWAANGTIQTSDERDKTTIKPSVLGLDFVKKLQPVSWVWADIDRPAVTEKRKDANGNERDHIVREALKVKHKRPHFGFVAQQVKQALDAVGVDDFAGYIYDEETDSYSLRYSEFLSPIVKALQELLQRVERLEKAN